MKRRVTATPPGLDRRFSIAPRILAVNIFAILALTGSIFYLDSFRERLVEQRRAEMRMQAVLIGGFMAEARRRGCRRSPRGTAGSARRGCASMAATAA